MQLEIHDVNKRQKLYGILYFVMRPISINKLIFKLFAQYQHQILIRLLKCRLPISQFYGSRCIIFSCILSYLKHFKSIMTYGPYKLFFTFINQFYNILLTLILLYVSCRQNFTVNSAKLTFAMHALQVFAQVKQILVVFIFN